jgi:outer membrane protein assembly factor BamB
MVRVDRGNSGRVAQLPQLPLQVGWPQGGSAGLAGGAYTSGVIVVNNNVVAASADGHLYSFDRESGAQRWRYQVGEPMTATPLADSGLIYALTVSGRLVPLTEQGAEFSDTDWPSPNVQPHGSPIANNGRILFTARAGNVDRLYGVDRTFGAVVQNIVITGTNATGPSVGGQMIFLAGDRVRAYDFFNSELVWQSAPLATVLAPPLYVSPGVEAAAELYLADANGILTALDANTGAQIWQTQIGGAADGLAANGTTLIATGNGFVRAFARARRSEGQFLWQAGIGGRILGGALIDGARVFVATDGGAFQYFDVSTGALIQGNVAAPQAAGAVAVSGPWIFVPSTSGVIYAARQVAQ